VDRKKELIKVKGFQVAPAELEALLLQHPKVAMAAVVGVYDKRKATEYPRAYIQLRLATKNKESLEQEIHDFINAKVSTHKQLRGGLRFMDVVPVSASGKILRKQVRLLAKEEEEQRERKMEAKL
jgi:4-coumarate--CoA ligase